ncbi:MAG: hypothetical protein M3R21_04860 [Candidatus Dormibacteraeota bacterium]|nr:hypothetical protein [Candidatus Dormibacteraeota bacterium]
MQAELFSTVSGDFASSALVVDEAAVPVAFRPNRDNQTGDAQAPGRKIKDGAG